MKIIYEKRLITLEKFERSFSNVDSCISLWKKVIKKWVQIYFLILMTTLVVVHNTLVFFLLPIGVQ